jgi:hypothetical protein
MMPFHPSFRFLLRKYIPQVSNEDLDRHESLMALRLQLKLERNMPPETPTPDYRQAAGESARDLRNRLIREATVQANGTDGTGIFSSFEREFNAVHRLWTARRQLALRPNPYSQTLSSPGRWRKLAGSVLNYYRVRMETFIVLEANRFRFFKGRILAVIILLVLAGLTLSQVVPSRSVESPQGTRLGPESRSPSASGRAASGQARQAKE